MRNFRTCFTLPEVLIVIGAIGVVAALTIPAIMSLINDKVEKRQVQVIEAKLLEGLNLLNSQEGGLSRNYPTTKDFVDSLSKYMKIVQVCDNAHLGDCFAYDEIYLEDIGKSVKISNLKTAGNLQLSEEGFEDTASFMISNGVSFLISYNQKCMEDTDRPLSQIPACVAGFYDYNGSNKPNKFGYVLDENGGISSSSDIKSFNGAKLSRCALKVGDLCITQLPFKDLSYNFPNCIDYAPSNNYGVRYCYRPNYPDYWLGAVDRCGHVKYLPSEAQLTALANQIYIKDEEGNVTVNEKLLKALGVTRTFHIWTKTELWTDRSRIMTFGETGASLGDTTGRRDPRVHAICVE